MRRRIHEGGRRLGSVFVGGDGPCRLVLWIRPVGIITAENAMVTGSVEGIAKRTMLVFSGRFERRLWWRSRSSFMPTVKWRGTLARHNPSKRLENEAMAPNRRHMRQVCGKAGFYRPSLQLQWRASETTNIKLLSTEIITAE